MPTIIKSGGSSDPLSIASASDGILELRSGLATGGVVGMTMDANQVVTFSVGVSLPTLSVRDEKADGTHAGVAVALSHQTRTLNTVVENSITGASLAANRVTLPAGTYRVWASAQHNSSDTATSTAHKIRLRNITAGTTTAIGAGAGSFNYSQSSSTITGFRFSIAATSAFEIQHWINSVGTLSYGLGRAATAGSVEIYAEALFVKEA